ncbi:hypothetical protein SAMN05880558_109105 [Aeromonas sp. RU39B]|jgi:hypothetical protein|uniref:hypothetical protein n=1 Tax=Aeromonas sp. RU39B TaxID=1907416 RepID=UPI0009567922|nr:hypothetical protein [Aeromonas sp. RU39B]SIR15551.1 hypothetical protein SAMN05880558_109105 [Aeromonas sp. RU39B]
MERSLVEIGSPVLFEEYLQSLGVGTVPLDQEGEIYLQERHLAAIRRVQGELRYYLCATELTRS